MGTFSWSFSKLEGFETCGKRYYEYSVAKAVKDTDTSNIVWGNQVHDALRDALKVGTPLPPEMAPYKVWVDRVRSGPGELMVEQKYALTHDLSPCPYFAPVVWYRGIADVVRIWGEVGLAIDWKTGKPKKGSVQLGLMALCLFQHFPKLQVVRTEFVWLNEDPKSADATTQVLFRRADMQKFMTDLLPRVKQLEYAHQTMTFPPRPGGLCVRYCQVTSCPFFGKGNRQ